MTEENRPAVPVARRVSDMPKSAIHEMTRLSKEVEDVAFLSWAKPTSGTPEHIRKAAVRAIEEGKTGGYSEPAGLPALREAIAAKLKEQNGIDAYLVFVYCLNDPDLDGPKSEREWRAAIKVMHEALGIRGKVTEKYVIDVFVDVGELG